MDIDETIARFGVYLQKIHAAFDKVKVGDNPELTAEEVWATFVELTEKHVMPLENDYAPAPVDEDGPSVGLCCCRCCVLTNGGGAGGAAPPWTVIDPSRTAQPTRSSSPWPRTATRTAPPRSPRPSNTCVYAFKYVRSVDWWPVGVRVPLTRPRVRPHNTQQQAVHPEKLYVGLVEQNCYANCRTGVLKDLSVQDAPPDVDCVKSK